MPTLSNRCNESIPEPDDRTLEQDVADCSGDPTVTVIPDVLDAAELNRVSTELERASFIDGRATAGSHAASVKRNREAHRSGAVQELQALVLGAIRRNGTFLRLAIPTRIVPPIFNRYDCGMAYGTHLDAPFMHGIRTDLAMSLALSDPSSYVGGELVVRSDDRAVFVKPKRGSLVVYPAGTLHCVRPVREGVRFAMVSWVQSRIREWEKRQLFCEMLELASWADRIGAGTMEAMRFHKVVATLSRMWGEV
jgi:PKHD-type hydroxylase